MYRGKISVLCTLQTALARKAASEAIFRNVLVDSDRSDYRILPACFVLGLEAVPHGLVLVALLYLKWQLSIQTA